MNKKYIMKRTVTIPGRGRVADVFVKESDGGSLFRTELLH